MGIQKNKHGSGNTTLTKPNNDLPDTLQNLRVPEDLGVFSHGATDTFPNDKNKRHGCLIRFAVTLVTKILEDLLSSKCTLVDHDDEDQVMKQVIKQDWFFSDAQSLLSLLSTKV